MAIEAEIPEGLLVAQWHPGMLPEGWRKSAAQPYLQAKGAAWLKAAKSGMLLVPSVLVPSEANLLINPEHPDAARIRVVTRTPFTLDPRLFG